MNISRQIETLETLLSQKVGKERQKEYTAWKKTQGATDAQLDKIESDFDIQLPSEFREFYKYKNGSGYHFHVLYPTYDKAAIEPFYLFSTSEIIEDKKQFWMEDRPMPDYLDKEECAEIDPRIQPYLCHHRWLPFAQLAGGDLYLLLDYAPTSKGKPGQIIAYIHDPDFVYYIAEDFKELLEISNFNLKNHIEEINY